MFSSGIEGKSSLYLLEFCEVNEYYAGLILESKGMRVIFQKKAKNEQNILKRAKNGEVFEDLGKSTQNWKIFCKMAGDNV